MDSKLPESRFGSAKLFATPNLMASDMRRMSPMVDISNYNVKQVS